MQYPQLGRAVFGALLALTGIGAQAADAQSPWLLRGGIANVVPTSSPGNLPGLGGPEVKIDNQYTPIFSVSYFLSPNVAVDVFGGVPPKHDIKVGGAKVASTYHAPPIVSLQYHFAPESTIRPYVGVGVNYTYFFNEKLDGGKLKLTDSWGLAAQVGVDYALDSHWTVGADVRYADIDTDVIVGGVGKVGNVDVNPFVYSLNVGYRF